jgi:hypothetical protein
MGSVRWDHSPRVTAVRQLLAGGPRRGRRKPIPATCGLHRGPIGFAKLMVSEQDRTIVFDPHVTGECVTTLDEQSARMLRDTLTEWLG